jgi:hypothetical protein
MRDRNFVFAALLTATTLLAPSVALGQPIPPAAPASTSVPINVGLVPYVDVNSHFVRPRNNVSLDAVAGSAFGIDGAAIAGVSGFVWGKVRGLQLAGVSGYVGGDLAGAQIGGVVSATRGTAFGLQAAGVVNYAGRLHGAQIGLVNVGGRVKGLQLGLVNVAEEADGATLGIINVVRRNGRHQIELSTSNTWAVWAGTKLGTRHVYTILGIGVQPTKARVFWMPTVGLGASIPILERGFVNVEALASAVNAGAEFDRDTILGQLRLTGGYRVLERLALFAGPALSALRSSSGKRLSDVSYTPTLATFEQGRAPVGVGLGFVVGMEAL